MAQISPSPTPVVDVNMFATGLLVPTSATSEATANVGVANRCYVCRFYCPTTMTVTKIAFATTNAATNNDNCDVGIFNAAGTMLLGSAGSTGGKLNAVAGVQTLALQAGAPLVSGTIYYTAFAYGPVGGTAASIAMTQVASQASVIMGSALPNALQTFQAAAFPVAAPFATAGAISSVPVLALLL